MKIFNISELFHKVPATKTYAKEFNTRFILLDEAAKKAVENQVINNKEVEELRLFLKQNIKKGPVTDTVYIENVRINPADKGLQLSGEFFADPLMCKDITLVSNKKLITTEELSKQMSEFRASNKLDKLATKESDLAEEAQRRAQARRAQDTYGLSKGRGMGAYDGWGSQNGDMGAYDGW